MKTTLKDVPLGFLLTLLTTHPVVCTLAVCVFQFCFTVLGDN